MRSRTELVTTTFDLDTDEEDYSPDDDDSEEDWRPNKKRQQKPSRAHHNGHNSASDSTAGRKRRTNFTMAGKAKRPRATKVSEEDDFDSLPDFDEEDDLELETDHSEPEQDSQPAASTSKRTQGLPPKKPFVGVKLPQLDLLLNKRDLLDKDWRLNSRLSLWRKDEQTSLLQKYLRVKSPQDKPNPNEPQLLFTSSSVYSSWDEQHIDDFLPVTASCLDANNRRLQLDNLEVIAKLAIDLQAKVKDNKDCPLKEQTAEQHKDA